MLTKNEGEKAVKFARQVITTYVQQKPLPKEMKETIFSEKQGVFVTLHTFPTHMLRGCIGIPLPVMPLSEAIIEAAQSVTRDPRFPPLQPSEIDTIIVEVTILTQPQQIQINQPKDYLNEIEIGRDGLIVEQGFFKGLLLPQVPIEQEWNKEEFLSQTCMKAGLPPDAWFDKETKIFKFTGQIFSELKPHAEIQEKKLDGSHC